MCILYVLGTEETGMNKDTALPQGSHNLVRELDTDIITIQSDVCSSGDNYEDGAKNAFSFS